MTKLLAVLGISSILLFCIYAQALNLSLEEIKSIRRTTLYVGGNGPGNFTAIQDAVDASVNGNTIYVFQKPYPYFENIIINKSIKLLGENQSVMIEANDNNKSIFNIFSDSVNIIGFSIPWIVLEGIHSDYGIYAYNLSNLTISNCYFGLWLKGIELNKIENSVISNNTFGLIDDFDILLNQSNNNLIDKNKIMDIFASGIILNNGSTNNIISNNNISNIQGLSLRIYKNSGKNNIIKNNDLNCEIFSDVNSKWQGNFYKTWIGLRFKILFFLPKIIPFDDRIQINLDWHPDIHIFPNRILVFF